MIKLFTIKQLKEQFNKEYEEELQEREEKYHVDTKWYNKSEPRSSKNSYELYRKIQSEVYTNGVECWQYFDRLGNWHILSFIDFLEQFEPYELAVSEYRYYIQDDEDGYLVTEEYYTDEEWSLQKFKKTTQCQRLDATKRIRYARC